MAQLSRPYQIALVALALLAAVWLLALRGHSSGGSGKSATTPAPHPAQSSSPGAPYTPYKGSAPGVAGLTRAIQKAKGAVAQSERNAKQLEGKSPQASNPSAGQQSSGSASSRSTSAAASKAGATRRGASRHVTRHKVATHATGTSGLPANQVVVERELKRGFSAAILFWSPKAADDVVVHGELQRLLAAQRHDPAARKAARELGDESVVVAPSGSKEKVAVHMSPAGKVASYGSFTRAIQVYQTPTLLIVNPKGQTVAITGITDAFSIEQALDEPSA
jgi:hypothetical protein